MKKFEEFNNSINEAKKGRIQTGDKIKIDHPKTGKWEVKVKNIYYSEPEGKVQFELDFDGKTNTFDIEQFEESVLKYAK